MVKVSRLCTPPMAARLLATLPSQASMLDNAVDAPPEVLTLVPVTLRHSPATVQLLLRHASGWSLALPSSVEPAWLAELLRGMV